MHSNISVSRSPYSQSQFSNNKGYSNRAKGNSIEEEEEFQYNPNLFNISYLDDEYHSNRNLGIASVYIENEAVDIDDEDSQLTHIRDNGDEEPELNCNFPHSNNTQHNYQYQQPYLESNQSKRTRHHAHLMFQASTPNGFTNNNNSNHSNGSRRLSGVSSASAAHSQASQYSASASQVFSDGNTTVGGVSDYNQDEKLNEFIDDTSDLEVYLLFY